MRIPEERSWGHITSEQQQSTWTGCSRRTFLLGGTIAALAGGGWWLHTQFSQPPAIPVDKHRILSLPLSGESAPPPFQHLPSLEYTWMPDSMHLAVALPDKIFLVNVRTGQTVWQQARSLKKEQDAILLVNWPTNGKPIQTVQERGLPRYLTPGGQIAWPAPSQMYNPPGWNPWEYAFSADRTYLAFIRPEQDSYVQIWNIPQRSLDSEWRDPEDSPSHPLHDAALSWSPTSPSLAIYANQRQPEMHLWLAGEKRLLWRTDISPRKGQPASEGQGG